MCLNGKRQRDTPGKTEESGVCSCLFALRAIISSIYRGTGQCFIVLTNTNSREYLGNTMKKQMPEKQQPQFHAGPLAVSTAAKKHVAMK